MKKILSILLLCLLYAGVSACSDSKDEPVPEPERPTGPVERAVLVYMSSHNNLGYSNHNDTDDIDEMVTAARNGDLGANRLIVFHAQWAGEPQLKEITSEGVKILKTYPESLVSVEEQAMRDIIADFKHAAQAKHYGLILWGHGSGWLENGLMDTPAKRSYGGHENAQGTHWWMNTTTLADVLEGENFDYLYFDCCFMASVEVAYELRHTVPAIVASSSELPAEGMPYHKSLRYLMYDTPNLNAAAKATFDYFNSYTGGARTCTISVINTSGLTELAQAVRGAYDAATTHPERNKIQQFVSSYDGSYYNLYFDLGHTLENLNNGTLPGDVQQALANTVSYAAATPYIWQTEPGHSHNPYEVKVDHHCGLTTFIPATANAMTTTYNYSHLQWATDVTAGLFTK